VLKLPSRIGIGTLALITTTAAVVVALAVIQYRWNQEASDATGVRLADSLQLSMINWHLDLFRNLSEVALTIRVPEEPEGLTEHYARRFDEWRSIARYPELVANLYIVRRQDADRVDIVRVAPDASDIRRGAWPPVVERFVSYLDHVSTTAPVHAPANGQLTESFYNIGSALRVWQFDPAAPALVRSERHDTEWLLVELNDDVLRRRIFPELAHRYFQGIDGLDYEVAVVSGGRQRQVIYTSDQGFGSDEVPDADGRMDIFGRATPGSGSTIRVFHRTSTNAGPTAAVGVNWFPIFREPPTDEDWQLIVRHRRGGPLGSFVTSMRRRGLTFSFIALLILVLSLSMLLVTTVRAQRLARLQLDFVTAVSHELRTPLTIIGSAADNIASGVVVTPHRVQEYGTVIGHEVAQLSGLVERILRFAAAREGRQTYVLEALKPAEIVETVLTVTGGLIRAGQFTVEREVAPDLPAVVGDRMAVSQCLENLVTNALKYGKEARWIRLSAALVRGPDGAPAAVDISVADRGIGIDPADQARIFEPFYRSRSVQVAQIHGTGLGLAVARQIAEALGGSLAVHSVPGNGSIFTLRLLAYDASHEGAAERRGVVLTTPAATVASVFRARSRHSTG
jgi:signal transduction histidine kinase